MVNEKHEFALFSSQLSLYKNKGGSECAVHDEALANRVRAVLRLEIGTHMVLFDEESAATVELRAVGKKEVVVQIIKLEKHKPLTPAIHWYVPLVDREALEIIMGILTVMGTARITFVETEKSRSRSVLASERIKRLMVAAAEQSKQFVLPVVDTLPIRLNKLFETVSPQKPLIFFDPAGESALNIVSRLVSEKCQNFCCLIGPEGDLTQQEKELLKQQNVYFCALTPSILRAEVAVTVAMGIVRSCVRQDV